MDEAPKSIWRRPLKGRAGILAWLFILTLGVFAVLLILGLISARNIEWSTFAIGSLGFSLAIATGAMLIFFFLRWLCCWRNVRRFLFGVACLITLVALFYAEEDWRGKRAWEQHRREWEAKGEKFNIADLAPPPVPDEKNFALTPLLKPALEFNHSPRGVVWTDTNGRARLRGLRAR